MTGDGLYIYISSTNTLVIKVTNNSNVETYTVYINRTDPPSP